MLKWSIHDIFTSDAAPVGAVFEPISSPDEGEVEDHC
jgi:hypothetical protein